MLSVILTGYGSTRNPRTVNLRAVTNPVPPSPAANPAATQVQALALPGNTQSILKYTQ
jgi:hypothetical protein